MIVSIPGCKAGVLYGLPKAHKPDIPFRPIISDRILLSCRLAVFLIISLWVVHGNEDYATVRLLVVINKAFKRDPYKRLITLTDAYKKGCLLTDQRMAE